MPSHPVMLQQGNEVIVAHKKGGVLLSEEHFDTFRSCMFIGNLNEIADVEMPRRTVKRQVNVPLAWHKSYVRMILYISVSYIILRCSLL